MKTTRVYRLSYCLVAVAASVMLALVAQHPVTSEQNLTCDNLPTEGKTLKQTKLEQCECEQKAATSGKEATTSGTPTFRVGAPPFGQKATLRVGKSARVGARRDKALPEPVDLYSGLLMPNLEDLQSQEVAGLKEKVLRAREKAWQRVEKEWQIFYRRAFIEGIRGLGYNKHPDKFFKADTSVSSDNAPEDYLKPEFFPEVLAYLRKYCTTSGRFSTCLASADFADVERQYERLKQIRNLTDQWHTLRKFDWREQGLDVGAVMQQGDCPSCWAFAAAQVYQSSWALEQIRTAQSWDEAMGGEDSAGYLHRFASVQQLLNCIGESDGKCVKPGWHGKAFALMVDSHVPHVNDRIAKGGDDIIGDRSVQGYTGRVSPCVNPFQQTKVKRGGGIIRMDVFKKNTNTIMLGDYARTDTITTNFDRALTWNYVNEQKPGERPSVEQLKQALIEHGPLPMPIVGDACFSVYKGGIFSGPKQHKSVNHVVVLIGWDDDNQAWLIKNSWGEEWGEKGFGWVAYDSNNIGYGAAWIQPTPITEFDSNELVGIWQASKTMATGWNDTYQFFPDGKFIFHANQMDCSKRIVSQSGEWNGYLSIQLLIKEQVVMVGGKLVKADGSCGSKYKLVGAKEEKMTLTPSKINVMEIPFGIFTEDESKRWTTLFGKKRFWKYSSDPTKYP